MKRLARAAFQIGLIAVLVAGVVFVTRSTMLADSAGEDLSAVAAKAEKTASPTVGPSGLKLPRFVSLKSDRVNVRVGPGRDYEVAWVFTRDGLPVEIIQEFEHWRQIRDSEGAEGWVFHSLLSSRRTALVAPGEKGLPLAIRAKPSDNAPISALIEPGVLTDVAQCRAHWCRIAGEAYSGWIEQSRLWGVYPEEDLD